MDDAGTARSFEITKSAGSRSWEIMASSTRGSLRMKAASKPPTVLCNLICILAPESGRLSLRYMWMRRRSRFKPDTFLSRPANKKAGVAAGFPVVTQACRGLMGGFQGFLFLPGNRALDRRLHLLEGADLDLPHTFAR